MKHRDNIQGYLNTTSGNHVTNIEGKNVSRYDKVFTGLKVSGERYNVPDRSRSFSGITISRIKCHSDGPNTVSTDFLYKNMPRVSDDYGQSYSNITFSPSSEVGYIKRLNYTGVYTYFTDEDMYISHDYGSTWHLVYASGFPGEWESYALNNFRVFNPYLASDTNWYWMDQYDTVYKSTDGESWSAYAEYQNEPASFPVNYDVSNPEYNGTNWYISIDNDVHKVNEFFDGPNLFWGLEPGTVIYSEISTILGFFKATPTALYTNQPDGIYRCTDEITSTIWFNTAGFESSMTCLYFEVEGSGFRYVQDGSSIWIHVIDDESASPTTSTYELVPDITPLGTDIFYQRIGTVNYVVYSNFTVFIADADLQSTQKFSECGMIYTDRVIDFSGAQEESNIFWELTSNLP